MMINTHNTKQLFFLYVCIAVASMSLYMVVGYGAITGWLLLLFLFFSLYFALKEIVSAHKDSVTKGVSLLVGIVLLYTLLHMLFGSSTVIILNDNVLHKTSFMKSVLRSLLPIYAFYYFSKSGVVTDKNIRLLFFVLLALSTMMYYYEAFTATMIAGFTIDSEMTNNVAYEFVALIPFLVFFKDKKLLMVLCLAYIMSFILISCKRGAILIGLVLTVYFLYTTFKTSSSKDRVFLVLLFSALIYAGINFSITLYNSSDNFQRKYLMCLQGDTNGRDDLYAGIWEYFTKGSFVDLLFGRGIDASVRLVGNYAHNDWLEMLIDFGLVGFFALLYYFKCFYNIMKRLKDSEVYPFYVMTLFILFLSSLFSMSITNTSIASCFALGYCFSNIPSRRNSA